MSAIDDDEQHPTVEDGQEQQQSTQTTTRKKKVTILRKISAKPAPKKTSPKRSTTAADVSAAKNNNRGQNDDDDEQQPEQQQQQAPAPRPTATRKSASPKPQAKKSTTATRSAEQNDFDAAVAFLHATAPSQASIITANAVAAVEAMERKQAEEQHRRRQQAEEELERQKKQQQEQQSAPASSSSTSSEPLIFCSECHHQLPKSEFSSSQAKKLVGRKCKQCVAKVAEIEAQLREAAAVNEVLEKINELPKLEQAQRKIIAEEEIAAFREVARVTPEDDYARRVAETFHAFLLTRQLPEPDDPRRPVVHEWLFSMESADAKLVAEWTKCKAPDETAAALMLRDKGWTLVAAFLLLAASYEECSGFSVLPFLMFMSSLIDVGALDMLPRRWRNEHNPLQQVMMLFRDSLQRMVQRVEPLMVHGLSIYFFGDRLLGAEFLACVLRILQHGDTETSRATEDDVVDFIKFLIDTEIGKMFYLQTVDRKDRPVGKAMSSLIRFLFIPSSDDSRCFVSRLLGVSDETMPERVVAWLGVLLMRCYRIVGTFPTAMWYRLIADLCSNLPPSVVARLLQKQPPSETRYYQPLRLALDGQPVVWNLFNCIVYDSTDPTADESSTCQFANAMTAIIGAAQKSTDPVFEQLRAAMRERQLSQT